jgi:hypothetical protein
LDGQVLAWLVRVGSYIETTDVTLRLEHASQSDLQLGTGHDNLIMHRRIGVADSGEHVSYGISHHRYITYRELLVTPGTSPA